MVNYIYRQRAVAAMVAGLALALWLGVPSAAAQTTFAWPDTTVDVAKYTRVEQCLAATDRVASGQLWLQERVVWRDTMPIDEQRPLRPAPAPVTATAARCAARYPVANASLRDFPLLLQLYLEAGRDADAQTLVERRLAAATAARERAAVSDSAVRLYLQAQPVRLDAAEALLVARAHAGADRLDRMLLYVRLMEAARDAGDTTRARRAAGWVVAVADSLTQAERESEKFTTMEPSPNNGLPPRGGNLLVFAAVQQVVGLRTLLDSLRHSTQAMVNLQRNMWAKIMHERPEALPLPIGEKAPTLTADSWFPHDASGTPHPAPGHVAIVEFVDTSIPNACLGRDGWGVVTDACVYPLTLLRRLTDRFPGIDITLAVGTHGSYLYVPPPSPADEAELIRKWLEPYRIPNAAIAVSTRPFWNLQRPDGRRVDKPTANETAYTFGKSWSVQGSGGGGRYLIDQDGIVVDVIFNEGATFQFVDVLVHRQKEGGAHVVQ
jgi:hypothetical protein